MLPQKYANQTEAFKSSIDRSRSVLIGSHINPDADSVGSMKGLEGIINELNPSCDVHCVADMDGISGDAKQLCEKYGFQIHSLQEDELEDIDMVVLVDAQLRSTPGIPDNVRHLINTGEVEVHIRDHHNLKGNGAPASSQVIDDSYAACVSLIMDEFSNTRFVQETIPQRKDYSTLGKQALKVDSHNYRHLENKSDEHPDMKAYREVFRSEDPVVLTQLADSPLSEDDARIVSEALRTDTNWYHFEDVVTYSHVNPIHYNQTNTLGAVISNDMSRVRSLRDVAILSAVTREKESDQNRLYFSIRSNLRNTRKAEDAFNAADVANLFDVRDKEDAMGDDEDSVGGSTDSTEYKRKYAGGGRNAAGAQIPLGIFKNVCNREEFENLLMREVKKRIQSSFLSEGRSEEVKPLPMVYGESEPLNEAVETFHRIARNERKDSIPNANKIMSYVGEAKHRTDPKYYTFGVNLNELAKEREDYFFSEADIPGLFEPAFFLLRRQGEKGLGRLSTCVEYALVNDSVRPYVLGLVCNIAGENDTRRNNLIQKLFGPYIEEREDTEWSRDGRDYAITLVKAPVFDFPYAMRKDLGEDDHSIGDYDKHSLKNLWHCCYNELEQRMENSLGKPVNGKH